MNPTILQVMTELTALSTNGIVILKPFRGWYGIPLWQDRKIGIRVLNAGEIEDAMDYISNVSVTAQDIALKLEIVARSLWSVDGAYVASKEDVDNYNELNKTELSELEYKRVLIHSFEHNVIEHLYMTYGELQKKQSRKVYGLNECAITKQVFTTNNIPQGSKYLLYNTSEIISPAGLEKIKPEDNFDFEKEVQPITIDSIQNQPVINASKTVKDFQTLEQYQDYLLEKAEQNALKTEAVSE